MVGLGRRLQGGCEEGGYKEHVRRGNYKEGMRRIEGH